MIIFVGILLGIGTPTEVSSFAVVYGLELAVIIYGEFGFREVVFSVIDWAAVSDMILLILACASNFSWVLTVSYLPQRVVEILTDAHNNQWLFMFDDMLLLIVTGPILEALPALLILAPLLLPIASQVGVSLLPYGIVLLIAIGIGAFTSRIGVGFYNHMYRVRGDRRKGNARDDSLTSPIVPRTLAGGVSALVYLVPPRAISSRWMSVVLPL